MRPWLTSERAPTALAERRWPEQRWYDALAGRAYAALFPAMRRIGMSDSLLVLLTRFEGLRLRRHSAEALRDAATALRPALLRKGFTPRLTARGFALVREATFRSLGFRHHGVQILGARQILCGRIAEMSTGEGKTITAGLAAAAMALAGVPVHVITVNDYLSERDLEELRPIYAQLGLGCAYIGPDAEPGDKQRAYGAAITYMTNKTLVFDYLRSRLAREGRDTRNRHLAARLVAARPSPPYLPAELGFCIVDEADGILIDEAQTPLLIAAADAGDSQQDCAIALEMAGQLEAGRHFEIETTKRQVRLLPEGEAWIETAAAVLPGAWQVIMAREEMVRQALSAIHLFLRDEHYIVVEDKVQIVDEFTGRVLADRQWQAGLHQMIEAKEGLETSASRRTLSQITFQRFFRRYLSFGGMTGTGREVARELADVYGLDVVRIPTHRRSRRRDAGMRLFGSSQARLKAVCRRVQLAHRRGRPVLVGTRSVQASEQVSAALGAAGLDHVVLNARQDADEADIIAQAGRRGAITVATNMAGRGTDIKLDAASRAAGGLHVILTEYHESARIDRQFFGRSGRQGDPGVQEALVSLDDDLFTRHAKPLVRMVRFLTLGYGGALPRLLVPILRWAAQRAAQDRAFRQRRQALERSDKLEKSLAFTRRPV